MRHETADRDGRVPPAARDAVAAHAHHQDRHRGPRRRAIGPSPTPRPAGSAARRFLAIPPLRCRLARIPFGLARPFWVDVGEFDLDYHVRRAAVAAPGGTPSSTRWSPTSPASALDRSKPLWQLWFVEGLEGGKVALVFKMHHSIADGFASVRIFEGIFSDAGESAAGEGAARCPVNGSRPGSASSSSGCALSCGCGPRCPACCGRTGAAMKAGRDAKGGRRRAGDQAARPVP